MAYSAGESPRRYRQKVLAKLAHAWAIVKEARTCLKDAMEFHGKKTSPVRKAMNQAVLETCHSIPSIRKRDAAWLATDLLTHIDPQHPVKQETMRVRAYQRTKHLTD